MNWKRSHLFAIGLLILCLFVVSVHSANSTTPDSSPTPDKKDSKNPAPPTTTDKGKSDDSSEDYTENPDDADEFDEETEEEFDMFDDDEDFGDTEGETSPKTNGTVQSGSPPSPPGSPPSLALKDISDKGNCSLDIKNFCSGLKVGDGVILACLTEKVKSEKAANDPKAATVTAACKSEIREFKIAMYRDISLDVKMEKECQADIKKYCDDDFLYPEPGNILACLREVKGVNTLTPACDKEVFRAEYEAAQDWQMDPQIAELCKGDVPKVCPNVTAGEGRVLDCLRSSRTKLSWDCQAELFRNEVENAADIRLNVRLFQACAIDKVKFCKDVIPGDARVKDCLEDHRLDPDFTTSCKDELEKMMERRAVDFRLDASLGKYCKSDISEICYPDAEDVTDVASWDAKVIQCLQDYRDELKNPKCRQQVRRLTKRASENWRFDKPFADACHEDRTSICKAVPDGMAQVLRCLQDHRETLKETCRSALFDLEIRMAEEIDFNFNMKKACANEVTSICKDIPEGNAAVIDCLRSKVDDADMGAACKAEVKRIQKRAAEDYRLSYSLNKACYNDVQRTCLHVCDKSTENGTLTCGGAVLKCLSLNKKNLTSAACKKEVLKFERQEAADITLDIPLQVACKKDLSTLCPKVSKDHSRTLTCLRNNRDSLSKACKAEELRFSEMEASDIRLTPSLMNACGQELHAFCKNVVPSDGQAFKCLQSNLEEVGMGAACKVEVNLQEARQASDYRLDASVKSVCEADANKVCADVDRSTVGHAVMLKCFVRNYQKLSGSCQTEVSYAVRSALFQYHLGADLTSSCDSEVTAKCQSDEVKEIEGTVIGTYAQCLMRPNLTALNEECRKLVKVMAKKGDHISGKINDEQLQDALQKLAALQAESEAAKSGIVLNGVFGGFVLLAILAILAAAGYGVYLKFYSPSSKYTLVVKSGDV